MCVFLKGVLCDWVICLCISSYFHSMLFLKSYIKQNRLYSRYLYPWSKVKMAILWVQLEAKKKYKKHCKPASRPQEHNPSLGTAAQNTAIIKNIHFTPFLRNHVRLTADFFQKKVSHVYLCALAIFFQDRTCLFLSVSYICRGKLWFWVQPCQI